MKPSPFTRLSLLTAVALAGAAAAIVGPAGSAFAATQNYTNACRNSAVGANWDQVNLSMSMTSPAGPVAPGDAVTLSGISMTMSVPGAIFVAGYNLGLLTAGTNVIPATVNAVIDATNSVEGSQSTGIPALPPGFVSNATLTTTITDPDGIPGNGNETATDASTTVTYADQTWHAASAGTMAFHEHDDAAITGASGGGAIAVAHLGGGAFNVQFHCTSGTVVNGAQPSPPAVVTITNAPTVTTTSVVAPNQAPIANAGPAQTVNSGASVTLDGSGSSDPDGNNLSYAWTQTGGPAVSLTGANTVHPTFTAPTGPADLTFSLTVTDDGVPPLSSTPSTVTVHVNAPADVTTTSLSVSQTGFVNEPITFNSTVLDTTTPASIPVGTVSWYDNGGASPVASAPVDGSGNATATLSGGFSATGSHSIVAKFVPTNSNLFEQSQSAAVPFDLARHANDPCAQAGSQCTDPQNFKVTVATGTLVISTPYTAANPFDLGTMALDPSGSYLHASGLFGQTSSPGDGVTITDTRAGDLPWTAAVTTTDFADGSNVINGCNLGFTGVTAVPIGGNLLGTPAKPVVTNDVPNSGPGTIYGPADACSVGLKGGPHGFATAAHGDGSVNVIGSMDLYAPTSTVAGIYTAIVTFTIS